MLLVRTSQLLGLLSLLFDVHPAVGRHCAVRLAAGGDSYCWVVVGVEEGDLGESPESAQVAVPMVSIALTAETVESYNVDLGAHDPWL